MKMDDVKIGEMYEIRDYRGNRRVVKVLRTTTTYGSNRTFYVAEYIDTKRETRLTAAKLRCWIGGVTAQCSECGEAPPSHFGSCSRTAK